MGTPSKGIFLFFGLFLTPKRENVIRVVSGAAGVKGGLTERKSGPQSAKSDEKIPKKSTKMTLKTVPRERV